MFPALIPLGTNTTQMQRIGTPDSFESGVLAIPVIITSIIVFTLAALHFKNIFPDSVSKILRSVFAFEISKKMTCIVFASFLIIYIALSAQELTIEEKWLDYAGVKARLESWNISQFASISEPHVSYLLDHTSYNVFGSYRIIPFLSSIMLVILTFFVTRQITEKNFAGLISAAIVLQSHVFAAYDTSVTYPSYWVSLYLASLYLINKKWSVLSTGTYILSIFSKALSAAFLPMSLYFSYRSNVSKRTKIITMLSYSIIGIIMLTFGGTMTSTSGVEAALGWSGFWQGFTSFSFQLRFDILIIIFLLPLIVGLFIASRSGIKQADSVMFLIAWTLFSAPLLTGFTDQTNQPYRFLPLVVFFAMGVGVLLSKRQTSE